MTTPVLFTRFVCFLLLLSAGWGCTSKPDQANAPVTELSDSAAANSAVAGKPAAARNVILFYGNSLTAGLGVEPEEAFPARVGEKIDSLQLNYTVINAGLSGETTAGGLSRIGWVLRQSPAVFVLELGGNDGLRGIPIVSSRRNLQAIIDTVRRRDATTRIVLAGMQIPPNMGQTYASEFRQMFRELATRNKLTLIPFLLEGVGGNPALNQPDGIHPTVAGHRIVANTVWSILKPLLTKPTGQPTS